MAPVSALVAKNASAMVKDGKHASSKGNGIDKGGKRRRCITCPRCLPKRTEDPQGICGWWGTSLVMTEKTMHQLGLEVQGKSEFKAKMANNVAVKCVGVCRNAKKSLFVASRL